jgi:hypothetical protein
MIMVREKADDKADSVLLNAYLHFLLVAAA